MGLSDLCVFLGVFVIWLCRGCKHNLSEELKKGGLPEGIVGLAMLTGLVLLVFFGWFLVKRISN
jgi:hypothetical protein